MQPVGPAHRYQPSLYGDSHHNNRLSPESHVPGIPPRCPRPHCAASCAGVRSPSRGAERSQWSRCHSACCAQSKHMADAAALGAAHARAARCSPCGSGIGPHLAQPRRSSFGVLTMPQDTWHVCAASLGTGLRSSYSTLCIKFNYYELIYIHLWQQYHTQEKVRFYNVYSY